jgi:aromatic ring-opening dioxygenase catalytic subunit (LigB family)
MKLKMIMRFPTVFVNHGGGPLPLLGKQPNLTKHMKEVRSKWLPEQQPTSIVVLSAHWESDPVKITSSAKPHMYYDYYGFPEESYSYQYNAPGSPILAQKIQKLFEAKGIHSELDGKRGFDHGVFIPLMLMYPEADIPVVCVSVHSSLSADINIQIGQALEPLRDEGVLILGSGYTFHNMQAFFHPTSQTYKASTDFNEWLKDVISSSGFVDKLKAWKEAPGARIAHPREEHLLPLLMTAAAGGTNATPQVIYNVEASEGEHAVSGYLFQ